MIQAVNCPALNHDELQRNEAYVMHDAVAHTWERVEIISRTRQIQVLGRPQTFNYQLLKIYPAKGPLGDLGINPWYTIRSYIFAF